MTRLLHLLTCLLVLLPIAVPAQTADPASQKSGEELKFVVYLSRHGVRSPTSDPAQHNLSAAPWPAWDVPPGYLTAHGYQLMQIFGAYDRQLLAQESLLTSSGCGDADHVTIYADSDQRTRETGKALAAGLFPGCNLPVQARAEGVDDPIFHPHFNTRSADSALAVAAIAGRIGGDPSNLTRAYHAQLAALDNILATCGTPVTHAHPRIPLFDIPSAVSPGNGEHMADLRGPLGTASSLVEDFLLEYAQGMDSSDVAWGCVDAAELRSLMDLHTASSDISLRTPLIARELASNLLDHIRRSFEQAVTRKPIAGAVSKPADRALFLVGHDTNITTVSSLLNIDWIADGRRDDTPPGGALIFELWKSRADGGYSVRVYFTVQTLEQMRGSAPLTAANPPQRVPVFIPGCSRQDYSCAWPAFAKLMSSSADARYIH